MSAYYAEVGRPDATPKIIGPFHAEDPELIRDGLERDRGEEVLRVLTEDDYVAECDAGLHG